jgi:hypothetical protein
VLLCCFDKRQEDSEECGVDGDIDVQLSEALRARLAEVEATAPGDLLTGQELAALSVAKYGVGAARRETLLRPSCTPGYASSSS